MTVKVWPQHSPSPDKMAFTCSMYNSIWLVVSRFLAVKKQNYPLDGISSLYLLSCRLGPDRSGLLLSWGAPHIRRGNEKKRRQVAASPILETSSPKRSHLQGSQSQCRESERERECGYGTAFLVASYGEHHSLCWILLQVSRSSDSGDVQSPNASNHTKKASLTRNSESACTWDVLSQRTSEHFPSAQCMR